MAGHQGGRGRVPGASELAGRQHGLISLGQLRELGVGRGRQRAQVAADRWEAIPYRGVVVGCTRESVESAWWMALTAVGRPAALGGITALQAAGLTGYDEDLIHLWLPKSSRVVRVAGARVHETRRWGPADLVGTGLPRATPAVAAVQAALWAKTPRQAVLCLVMPVQQQLARGTDVAGVLERVRRHRFRSALRAAITDITDGAHSMNELDFTALCRRHGLPEPSRQSTRTSADGTIHLDVEWPAFGVVVEINGAGHARVEQLLKDNFRMVDLQLAGRTAFGLSVLTLRAEPERAMRVIAEALTAKGWTGSFRPAGR